MKTNRRDFLKTAMGAAFVTQLPAAVLTSCKPSKANKKKNVLFIVVEDLKNVMGCYGNPVVKTPNIDRLAKKGIRFDRAYCQYPVCNPSRSSLMTGLRVDSVGIYDNRTPWSTNLPENIITMPALFRNNGYHTVRLNKIFHGTGQHDDPQAWSETYDLGTKPPGQTGEGRNLTNGEVKWCSWLAAEGSDEDQQDGQITSKAIEIIKEKRNNPFFVALGLAKPHDPFHAPKKYFELYNEQELMPPVVPDNRSPEKNYTIQSGWKDSFDKFSLKDKRQYLRAYYACVSFMDAQIGRVMDVLDEMDLWKDTVVLFAGDHGYNLGEHDWWNKNVLFEDSARVPMIAVVEDETFPDTVCDQLVELVDIYPTLAELCGLTIPDHLEGLSFKPLLSNSDLPWKKAAYTQVRRQGNVMGRSIRTKRWRYIEWGKDNQIVGAELYDHASDPGEYRNLAHMPEFEKVCTELSDLLKNGMNKIE